MMFDVIKFLVYIVMGLVIGAFFSEHMSMNLVDTEWTNLWVYAWLIAWPIFVVFKFMWYFFITMAILVLGYYGYMTITRGR